MRTTLFAAVMISSMPAAAWADSNLPLLPMPATVTSEAGSFSFARATIAADDAGGTAAARRLAELVARTAGPKLVLAKSGAIRFRRDPAIKGDEAYRLRVTPAAQRCLHRATPDSIMARPPCGS